MTGRVATRSVRRRLALLSAATAVLTMAIAAPAQAHTRYTVQAWGANSAGELGDGTSTGPEECGVEKHPCSTKPIDVSNLSGVTAVVAGGRFEEQFSLALLENGTVVAWGSNNDGQLGNGTTNASDVPVAVKELKGVTAIAAGADFGLALLKNGAVMAWGDNAQGQLGNGTTTNSDVPVEATGLSEAVTAIGAGGEHSLAVLTGGAVVAWGENNNGQLGNGTETSSDVPVAVCAVGTSAPCVSHLEGASAVAGNSNDSAALLSNGTVVDWGNGSYGALGNGTETNSHVPVAVSGLSGVTAIADGGYGENGGEPFTLALLGNGTVEAWGDNGEGQLGVGTSTGPENCEHPVVGPACSKTPVAVSGLSGVTAVAARGDHSLALLSAGTARAWGENSEGELGDGMSTGPEHCLSTACSTTPVEVSNLVDAKGIGVGDTHSLAFGPPPTVTNVEPDAGLEGKETSVTITGTDFAGTTTVKFGSTSATSFSVNPEGTSITAVSPAEPAGTVDVTVTNGWGTSATTPADQFTYVKAGAAPTVTKVKPHKGPLTGGTTVTIKGTNFTGVTAVKFGSRNATSFTVLHTRKGTAITAISPAGKVAKETVAVTVTTPNGTSSGTVTRGDRFKYVG